MFENCYVYLLQYLTAICHTISSEYSLGKVSFPCNHVTVQLLIHENNNIINKIRLAKDEP